MCTHVLISTREFLISKTENPVYLLCMFFIKNQGSLLTFLSTAVIFYWKELQYPIHEVKHRAI